MAMSHEDLFKAALSMIHVTPENHKTITAKIIKSIYAEVAKAEKELEVAQTSVYEKRGVVTH